MANQVCNSACMQCSFGVAPAVTGVLPVNRVMTSQLPAATIMDNKPMLNIPSFGMCSSLANPEVAAATAAAMGVLSPMPCVPMVAAPWAPGDPRVVIGGKLCLNNTSKLMCAYAGVISLATPGQVTVETA